jgi:hypothetical protein
MKLAIIIVAGVALSTRPLAAQSVVRDARKSTESSQRMEARLAGTWRLVATRQVMTDGTVRPDPDLGAKPSGYLMLDGTAGRMCTVINNGDRPKWPDRARPTDAEAHAIWTQTVGYCATWEVDPTGRELVYRLEVNLSPNAVGAERRRRFSLDGDRLVLYPTPLPPGVSEWTVEWRRAPSAAHRP